MSNDLISRSAVVALIESKCIDGCLGTDDMTLIDAYALIDEVSEMPTVYDVDEVVEQLNKEYTDAIEMLNDNRGTALEFSAKVRCNSYKRATEIVKAGGVNE